MRPIDALELHAGAPPGDRYGIPERPDWHQQALCHGETALFFPTTQTTNRDNRRRWDLCRRCPVRNQCWEAGQEENFGWWGGASPNSRGVGRNRYGPDPLGDIA